MSLLSRKKTRHLLTGLITMTAIGVALSLMFCFNLFYGIQLQSSDLFFRTAALRPERETARNVVIIAIDDRSLEQLGRLPSWPRAYHAQLIDTLADAGARVVVFDVLFSEAAPDDDRLAASMRRAGNVVLPVVYTPAIPRSVTTGNTANFENFLKPLGTLESSAVALGHANVLPDEDGVVRRLPLVISGNERDEPALSLAAVSKYLRRPRAIESPIEGNSLLFAGRSISLDNANRMLINYTGASAQALDFEKVSYLDVMRGNVDPAVFRDKIILVGATASGLGDVFWTPLGGMMNGVELHANAMNTILAGGFLRPAPSPFTIASIIALALLCGLLVMRLRIIWASLSAVALCILYLLAAFIFFDRGTMLNLLYPPVAVAGSFVGMNLYNVAYERTRKMEIARTFGRYVSTPVVDRILAALEQDGLKLGGEERDVTVAFADIRGFTTLVEGMPPEKLVTALNAYLAAVIGVFTKHEGMVNKFGGDSIMAVWNAPTDCNEHALSATVAAVEAQEAVRELMEKDSCLPRISFGIGVNTGKATAGNLGCKDRLEYSVIGDCVNVAARLTAAAPGGRVWIGVSTYELVKDRIPAKPVEPFMAKGKREPIKAYEIIGIGTDRQDQEASKSGTSSARTLVPAREM